MRLPSWLRWRSDSELREEIEQHLETETHANLERGLSPQEARYAAQRAFGNPTSVREIAREANPLHQFGILFRDLGHAIRLAGRTPLLALVVILTLTLGIGLNSAVFTVLNAALLRPLVTKNPDTFIQLIPSFSGQYSRNIAGAPFGVTLEEYEAFRNQATSFTELAVHSAARPALGGENPDIVRALLVSCNYLSAHFAPALLGRTFLPEDCAQPGGEPVVVLSEAFWRGTYQADPEILGRKLILNKNTFVVIGVLPDGFAGMTVTGTEMWIPYTIQNMINPGADHFRTPSLSAWLDVTGRLKPGVSRKQAEAELATITAQLDRSHPGRVMHVRVTDGSMIEQLRGMSGAKGPVGMALMGLILVMGLLILLLVCANVTTILLARAAARRQEMAVRASLGAGRGRLFRQLLTETGVLALVAAGAGMWLAYALPSLLFKLQASIPGGAAVPLSFDWRVFAYTLSAAVFATCAAAISPAVESLRFDLAAALKPLGRGAGGRTHSRIRSVLIATQLAISLAALTSAALILRAQTHLLSFNPGYDPESAVIVELDLTQFGYDQAASQAFVRTLMPQLEALPAVQSVVLGVPFRNRSVTNLMDREVDFRAVSSGYFNAMGIRILRGRIFDEADLSSVVISETFARSFWPGQDPIGKRWRDQTGEHVVVGLASDTSSLRVGEMDGPIFYTPAHIGSRNAILIRSSGNTESLILLIRARVRQPDPQVFVAPTTVAAMILEQTRFYGFVLEVLSIPTVLTLLLSLLGIYGVASYAVAQRTHEIGIRLALGAERSEIIRLLLRSVSRPLVVGLVCGTLLAGAIGFVLQQGRVLAGLSAIDPLAYLAAALLVVGAAVLATFIPTRRAARLDPWRSLRDE